VLVVSYAVLQVSSATSVNGKPIDLVNRDAAATTESRRLFLCAHVRDV
jgi:hypothetical protein